MTAVQAHGEFFESEVIKIKTNGKYDKESYDKLKEEKGFGGYTSPMDLVKGLGGIERSAAAKASKGVKFCTVNCGNILDRMDECKDIEFELIVGMFVQVDKKKKHFHTQYVFYIKPEFYGILWGSMSREDVVEFDTFVRNIPNGKEAQVEYNPKWKRRVKELRKKKGYMQINAKVDSKDQRRVQCSITLKNLLKSGIPYEKSNIDMIYNSGIRKYKK
jgi:hypothetical protein